MASELRVVLRGLRRTPSFGIASALMLGAAIGGTTAMSSFVRGILLSPLPYRDAEELVAVSSSNPAQGFEGLQLPAQVMVAVQEQARSFSAISGVDYEDIHLAGGGEPLRVTAANVLPDFLTVLGVSPALGRSFAPGETEGVALLGHGLWMSRFGGSPEAVGSALRHDGELSTVVGVLPAGFEIPLRKADALLPMDPAKLRDPEGPSVQAFARLRPGATLESARAELASIAQRYEDEHQPPVKGWLLEATALRTAIVGEVAPTLWMLQGAVLLGLLVACANFAGLLLARVQTREREVAIRRAVGASTAAIVRLVLAESVVLGLVGGILGLLFGRLATELLLALAPEELPRASEVSLDAGVLGFGLALALLSVLVAAALPAALSSRVNAERALRSAASSATRSPASGRLQAFLATGQVAVAMTLTVACGLFVQSFAGLLAVDPGFDSARMLTFELSFPIDRYPEAPHRSGLLGEALERIEALHEIEAAAASTWTPMTGSWAKAQMSAESASGAAEERSRWPMVLRVSPGFFRALGISSVSGRGFDREETGEVAIVNRRLAERAWPGLDAVGRRIKFGGPGSDSPWIEVVGVVEDARMVGLALGEEEAMFQPLLPLSYPYSRITILARTRDDPLRSFPSVRAAIWGIDDEVPLSQVRSMDQLVQENRGASRFRLIVVLGFTVLAVGLAALGIYATLGGWVASRRREIGIRMALGAEPSSVLRLVAGRGALLVAIGALSGVLASLLLAGLLESLLFEVSAWDPATFAGAVLVLGGVGIAAALLPARRAVGLDPIATLRAE